MSTFNLRGFLADAERDDPHAILRFKERISLDYDATAVALELERGRSWQSPVLWFDNVEDFAFPVVTNVFATRRRYALAFGTTEDKLITEWASRGDRMIEPRLVDNAPVHEVVYKGADADLGRIPIKKHFERDAGRYITNGIVIANDPDTGVRNASFHRMQVKGRTRLGTSLHSRRHLWDYVKRAEESGKDIPIAVVIGAHPIFTFAGLWKGPLTADEYAVAGGLRGAPLEIARCKTVPIDVPAEAEIVLEGHILRGVREPEGPFAEFTGYHSERSTEQVIEISAITHRRNAVYHDIVGGMSDEHCSMLAVPQEARLLRALRSHMSNVTAVSYPKSGTCRLHAYIAMRNPTVGQQKNAAMIAFAEDLSLKLVVVVDDDVDIFNDQDVFWAMATRMQADEDIDIIRNAFGAILDPSNHAGRTAKMIIDATKPSPDFPQRHTLPESAVKRAKELLANLKR
ncbi:MAG: UbiD family decarboxylase [Burkholderiales bacterium]